MSNTPPEISRIWICFLSLAKPKQMGIPNRRRWAGPPSGLLRYASQRLRAAQPSENLAPRTESTYNNNQPIGDLSELTKNKLPLASLSAPPQ
jgi:hypothetical protein